MLHGPWKGRGCGEGAALLLREKMREFPGSPVVRTWWFHYPASSSPRSGNSDLASCSGLVTHTQTHTHKHSLEKQGHSNCAQFQCFQVCFMSPLKKAGGASGKESVCLCRKTKETRVRSLGWEDPLVQGLTVFPVFLPGKSHGQRSLVGYSPWGCRESGMTERLPMRACRKAGIFPPGQSAHWG